MPARRVCRVALLIFLSGAIAGVVQAQGPGRRGEKYALLIGVRKYDPTELRSLPYSEADVTELADVLKSRGYKPGNVVLMTQTVGAEEPRFLPLAAHIRRELRLLLQGREPEDIVLVALAGHGVQFRGDPEHYFCPADTHLTDKSTLIALGEFYKELEASGAGLKVLLVDACRNDPLSDNSRSRTVVDLESVTRPQVTTPPGSVAALFSCSAGERSFEYPELRHGVFFHFAIAALRGEADFDGDRQVALEEVSLYTKGRVADFVRAKLGERQMPERIGQERGLLPIVSLGEAPFPGDREMRPVLGTQMRRPTPGEIQALGAGREAGGAVVTGVHLGSPGEKAGLLPGDLIVALGGKAVASMEEVHRGVQSAGVDKPVPLKFLRRGEPREVMVTLTSVGRWSAELLRLDPKDAASFRRRGQAFSAMGNPDAAIADLTKATRLDPKDPEGFVELARVRIGKRDFGLANADAVEAIRLDPGKMSAYLARADALKGLGRLDEAIAAYTQAIHLDPSSPDIHRSRAVAFAAKQDYDLAIADLSEAIRLDPKFAKAYHNPPSPGRGGSGSAAGPAPQAGSRRRGEPGGLESLVY
jgi:membrane-associated protease RseP (regulator of RpoE activity)